MIRVYQKEDDEKKNSEEVISQLVNKNIRAATILIRATPIMEVLTGLMIAGFIFYSGKLINAGELEVNNFFDTLQHFFVNFHPHHREVNIANEGRNHPLQRGHSKSVKKTHEGPANG